MMRNVKLFKANLKRQVKRKHELEERLDDLRGKWKQPDLSYQQQRAIERDGEMIKDEIQNLTAYIAKAERAIRNWFSVSDSEIKALTDFKYWKRA